MMAVDGDIREIVGLGFMSQVYEATRWEAVTSRRRLRSDARLLYGVKSRTEW